MTEGISSLAVLPAATAFFFDFDGTLAEIVEDPQAVTIGADILNALAVLSAAAGGAVAVISGREISALDRFLAPLRLPLGGAHGSERRDARGKLHRVEVDAGRLAHFTDAFERFAKDKDGLIVEPKRTSVALHYRRRPELEADCRAIARSIAEGQAGVSLLEGKMVVELKLSGRTKGDLVAQFMAEPPFRGRRPIFFGDDVTDEDAFRALGTWDGISVKIGDGDTAATHRMADPRELRIWLKALADRAGGDAPHTGTLPGGPS